MAELCGVSRLATLAAFALCVASARADECDAMVAKLVSEHGVTFERRTDLGTIHLRHAAAKSLSIDCTRPAGRPPSLNLSWDGAYPAPAFYALAGRAGAIVLGRPAAAIETAAKRCQRAALADADGDGELRVAGMEFGCSAFTQRGGGTHIAIRLELKS